MTYISSIEVKNLYFMSDAATPCINFEYRDEVIIIFSSQMMNITLILAMNSWIFIAIMYLVWLPRFQEQCTSYFYALADPRIGE